MKYNVDAIIKDKAGRELKRAPWSGDAVDAKQAIVSATSALVPHIKGQPRADTVVLHVKSSTGQTEVTTTEYVEDLTICAGASLGSKLLDPNADHGLSKEQVEEAKQKTGVHAPGGFASGGLVDPKFNVWLKNLPSLTPAEAAARDIMNKHIFDAMKAGVLTGAPVSIEVEDELTLPLGELAKRFEEEFQRQQAQKADGLLPLPDPHEFPDYQVWPDTVLLPQNGSIVDRVKGSVKHLARHCQIGHVELSARAGEKFFKELGLPSNSRHCSFPLLEDPHRGVFKDVHVDVSPFKDAPAIKITFKA